MTTKSADEVFVDERLHALPFDLEVNPEGQIVLTSRQQPPPTWDRLADEPILPTWLDDVRYKVETNARGQILMSPPPNADHQEYASEVIVKLSRLLSGGRALPECGAQTSDGIKVPDVVWASDACRRARGRRASFPVAPEICGEIISPGNTRREIEQKKRLYFEAGAGEFWRVDRRGEVKFFDPAGPMLKSRLCPEFPDHLNPLLA